jgi:hypothetical protein
LLALDQARHPCKCRDEVLGCNCHGRDFRSSPEVGHSDTARELMAWRMPAGPAALDRPSQAKARPSAARPCVIARPFQYGSRRVLAPARGSSDKELEAGAEAANSSGTQSAAWRVTHATQR